MVKDMEKKLHSGARRLVRNIVIGLIRRISK